MAGTIIDVRSPQEFQGENATGSINIPLDEIVGRIEEIKKMEYPILLCCASGNRSEMATRILSQEGVSCENGGSWMEVDSLHTQNG